MKFDVSVALTWILFLALFPMAFFWFRRAWRIVVKRDFSEVAIKRGESPPNPEKYAPYAMAINLIAGAVVVVVIVLAYIWAGLTETAAIAAIAINKLPTAIVTLREGTRTLDRSLDEMATVFALDCSTPY